MGTPIEERVFAYARGASAVGPEQKPIVIQQVIDLAQGDIEILRRVCRYCENVAMEDGGDAERAQALLKAAIRNASHETGDAHAYNRPEHSAPLARRMVTLALFFAKEDVHVSVAESRLLAAARANGSILEVARTLALEQLAAGLAAGDTVAISALSILEGACRRTRDSRGDDR